MTEEGGQGGPAIGGPRTGAPRPLERLWGVVTGASGGLGAALARDLASRGANLVLTARREEPMEDLAGALCREHGVQARVVALDLARPGAADALLARLDELEVVPTILVANAGFGLFGPFPANEPDRLRAMLELDVLALTELVHRVAQRMAGETGGRILLVASMAAYQPTPLYAAYGAAKAFVLSLGEALNVELAPKVGVTVLSPGLMDTGFLGTSGQVPTAAMRRSMTDPALAARVGIDALLAGRSSVVAGRLNGTLAFLTRFASRRASARFILRLQGSS